MSIDYDSPGYCAISHEYLMKKIVVKGKPELVFSGKATSMNVDLSDGSKMTVSVCKKCKAAYDHEKDATKLMESVIKGWEVECDKLIADDSKPHWDARKKKEYMDKYSKLEILKDKLDRTPPVKEEKEKGHK